MPLSQPLILLNERIGCKHFQTLFVIFVVIFVATSLTHQSMMVMGEGAFIFYSLASLGLFLPNLAASAKWCHDRGKSDWRLPLIPPVGRILREAPGMNRFGTGPLPHQGSA
ncbi:MAG TPA: DUF805 domain-containing protein [Azospirillaceae bacterium]|nr:DUF805 domain-containing protein [Azospirillaceae bacterium]